MTKEERVLRRRILSMPIDDKEGLRLITAMRKAINRQHEDEITRMFDSNIVVLGDGRQFRITPIGNFKDKIRETS